jgi:CubicO group peptidase (beta-lactamase class C family)
MTRPARPRLALEALEPRLAPAVDPFASVAFQQAFLGLLEEFGVPQASVAAQRDGVTWTYVRTNESYFTDNNLQPGPLGADSLFRIGSVSKSFTSTALMTLVQAGHLNLSDSAVGALGYQRGDTIQGTDSLDPSRTLSATIPDVLFAISIADVMGMTSGLPLEVPVRSRTFPDSPPDQVIYTHGSYAALAFAGAPPYALPATSQQQVRYYLYQVAAQVDAGTLTLPTPGSVYEYNDTGYSILGNIVDRVATQVYGLGYADYLQTYVLDPLGIQPATGSGALRAGVGRTPAGQAYPGEVTYYTYPNEPPAPSVFPAPTKTAPPFYPTDANGEAVLVPAPYGGGFYLESHFGNGGLVATPRALVQLFANLAATLEGTGSGPLSQQSVVRMVQEPPIGEDLNNGWYGLGWQVYVPATPAPNDTVWFKNGDLPGNSAELYRYEDGTVWAAAFNIDVLGDGTGSSAPSNETPFAQQLRTIIDEALYAPAELTAAGTPQTAPVNTAFAAPSRVTVTDAFGEPLPGVAVTFAAPASGPSGTFAGSPSVVTDAQGVATAPAFTANGVAGSYTVTAMVGGLSAPFALTNVIDSPVSPVPPVADQFGPPDGDGAVAAYVRGLYHNVLGRDADPAGLDWWAGQLLSPALAMFLLASTLEAR